MHLILDGIAPKEKLISQRLIFEFLDELPAVIGMNKIISPYVIRYDDKGLKDWGYTGFVIIAESHISIHTFPEHSLAYIDIFSCKGFDCENARQFIIDKLEFKIEKEVLIERGLP